MEQPPADVAVAHVKIKLSGIEFETNLPVPRKPVPARVMLPVFRAFAGAIVNASDKMARDKGRTVSCRAGCGACCRQLVPIAYCEAAALRQLVDHLPEPRRSAVVQRFADAMATVRGSDLAPSLEHPGRHPEQTIDGLAQAYFRLGIPCPFLEEESCSIYPERPVICREYLVTSPAEFCAIPADRNQVRMPLAARTSTAVMLLDRAPDDKHLPWVPLIALLEWTENHPESLPAPGTEMLGRFLETLGNEPAL